MMKSLLMKSVLGVLVVLGAGAAGRAELKLVANFDSLTGTPDGQACNGVLGGFIDTESENTGNSSLATVGGSVTMSVIGHSSGTLARAIGVGSITNAIEAGETGVAFFRFMMTTGGTVRTHLGLIADTTTNPINSARTSDPETVPAGVRLVDNGNGFDLVTLDGATVLKAGLARSQWYNVWLVANHEADTFDLYVSAADGPAGAATLPNPEDLVKAAIPFAVTDAGALNGLIFANPISPTGSGQATRIYVDEIWWDGDEGLWKPTMAGRPSPANEQSDVPRDVILSWTPAESAVGHNVYFGTSPDDVAAATVDNPLDVLVSAGQDANTFDPPGLLALGQVCYWRVDEIDAAPDTPAFKGAVWSFTVEPVSYPIQNIQATASSFSEDMGPEKTVDGSGLDANDLHSVEQTDMWLSAVGGPQPTWIQYEFDGVYKLDRMLVWNYNQLLEPAFGFGAKNVTVEYSTDGVTWTALGEVEFVQAPGKATCTADTVVGFQGAVARYVKLTINSNWGGLLTGLSEVRFFYIPVVAREPVPAAGQTGVGLDAVLSWRSGREAASHQVAFSTDQQAVIDGNAPIQTVDESRFDPGALELGTSYYWAVTEVNDAATPAVWPGAVWDFTTREYLVVDDFESYNDEENVGTRIYETWIDGWTTQDNGSTVGNWEPPFAERVIVHGGAQAMPMDYNNIDAPFYSEAYREFSPVQDWTVRGADTLRLWVRGYPVSFQEDGVITMSGAGHDIWDNADDFRFAHQPFSGNGSITVKVESIVNTHNWAKAGVMIRESLEADSKFAYMVVSAAQGVSFGWRPVTAGTCDSASQAGVAAPQWVKLTRTGDVFTAQYSADGQTWTDVKNADGTVASTTISMPGSIYIGLCVTSHNSAATTTAEFSGAAVSSGPVGSWQVTAIGDDPQSANSPGDLYVTVQDSANKTATAVHPTAVTMAEWTEWKIPLSDFAGVNMTKVKRLYIGVGDRANPTADGTGRTFIDDIAFGRPVAP
jgi:regulation of enolase protein 1 (concanavalin A-like superfamily)